MTGFLPSFQFLARRGRSRDPLTRQKQNKERTFLYGVWCGFGENISCGTQRVISKGQGHSAFSPARVANNSVGFGSSLPCVHVTSSILTSKTKQSLKVLSSSGIRVACVAGARKGKGEKKSRARVSRAPNFPLSLPLSSACANFPLSLPLSSACHAG